MSIQIVDNFQLNAGLPIDTRMVASGSVARDSIQYKYEGLRVFDLSDGVPYAWRGGVWVSENSLSLFGFGTASYIPKYKDMGGPSGSNVLENTIIVEKQFGTAKRIGIDTENFTFYTTGNPSAPNPAKLAVEGIIGTRGTYPNGGFFGDGAHISNINADNISTGSLNLNRIQLQGGAGDILTRNTTTATWINPVGIDSQPLSGITVRRSNEVKLTLDTTAAVKYFVFYDASTIGGTSIYTSLYTNTSKPLSYQPSTGYIGVNLTTTPTAALDVNGQIKLRLGSPGDKKLLMSDTNGLASWKPQAEVSVPVGTIIMWGGSVAGLAALASNWILCNGQQAPSSSLLYSQLVAQGNPFGGGTGKVPDLRERFVVGAGGENTTQGQSVAGAAYTVGQFGGFNEITLNTTQIPGHIHNVSDVNIPSSGAHKHVIGQSTSNGSEFATMRSGDNQRGGSAYTNSGSTDGAHTHTVPTHDTNSTGGGQPHENRPPYFALCYIIKIN